MSISFAEAKSRITRQKQSKQTPEYAIVHEKSRYQFF